VNLEHLGTMVESTKDVKILNIGQNKVRV